MSGGATTGTVGAGQDFDPSTLDDQERLLLKLLADGLVLDAVARRLSISERTLRRRIRSLCDRVGVDAPVQVLVWAARTGLL